MMTNILSSLDPPGSVLPVHPHPSPGAPLLEREHHLQPTCAKNETRALYRDLKSVVASSSLMRPLLKFQNFPGTPICLPVHISPGFCRRGNPMEVIDDRTVFFFGILPDTLLPTGKSSSPSSSFRTRKVVLKFLELSLSTMPPSLS